MAKLQINSKSKKIKKIILKISGIVLSLAVVAVGTYAILKFTTGKENKTGAPGSDRSEHRIEQDLNSEKTDSSQIEENSQDAAIKPKSDVYFEQKTSVQNPEEEKRQENNVHHRRGTDSDEITSTNEDKQK